MYRQLQKLRRKMRLLCTYRVKVMLIFSPNDHDSIWTLWIRIKLARGEIKWKMDIDICTLRQLTLPKETSKEFDRTAHDFPVSRRESAGVTLSSLFKLHFVSELVWSLSFSTTGGRASGGVWSRLRLRGVGQPLSYLRSTYITRFFHVGQEKNEFRQCFQIWELVSLKMRDSFGSWWDNVGR